MCDHVAVTPLKSIRKNSGVLRRKGIPPRPSDDNNQKMRRADDNRNIITRYIECSGSYFGRVKNKIKNNQVDENKS